MSKALTEQDAYERALNRQIGGIMPYNVYEQSPRPRPRRKAKMSKEKHNAICREYHAKNKEAISKRKKAYYQKKLQKVVTKKRVKK